MVRVKLRCNMGWPGLKSRYQEKGLLYVSLKLLDPLPYVRISPFFNPRYFENISISNPSASSHLSFTYSCSPSIRMLSWRDQSLRSLSFFEVSNCLSYFVWYFGNVPLNIDFTLKISFLYFNYIPTIFNNPVNNSNDNIPQFVLGPVI